MNTVIPSVADSSRVRRAASRVVAAALLLTGIVGVLHMPFAAPFLRSVFPSICPMKRGTPEQIDRAHALAVAAIQSSGTTAAPARPALGFELDKSTKADLDAWAAKHKVSCASIAGNATLQKCTAVPAAAVGQPESLGALEEVTFEFQSTGALVNVQTLRRHLSPAQAAAAVSVLEQDAASVLGAPTTVGGEPTAEHLSRGLLATYVAVHHFTDYRATVSATNLASTGMMVREEYISAAR